MPAPVIRLTERNLESTFGRTPWMLVRVDRVPMSPMQRGLAEYLDFRFPNLFTFVTVGRSDFSPARLGDLFQSAVGPLRAGVRDGYYLLEAGLVVGNHSGQLRPSSVSYGSEAEEEAQRSRILASPAGAGLGPRDLEALRQLVAYFEPIVERKQRAAGFGSDGFSGGTGSAGSSWGGSASYGSTPTPPPAAARTDDPDDPYVVLGVQPGATQEQIKAAFREQLKLNHPDKVAHLSPALQAFAAQQTLKLKAAYERLVRRP